MKLSILSRSLVLIGAINWLCIALFNTNVVHSTAETLRVPSVEKFIYLIIGVAAIVLCTSRDYYLPFLGECVFPQGILKTSSPQGYSIQVSVKAPPGSKVVYWASEKLNDESFAKSPNIAYGSYDNGGVSIANVLGEAVLKVKKPVAYNVSPLGMTKRIPCHIHYRVLTENKGIFGPVQTIQIPCDSTAGL